MNKMTKRLLSKTHKVFLTLIACLIVNIAVAHVPQIINYQGVALNANGTPIANSTISLQLLIAEYTNSSSALIYSEERQVTTDASGLFDVQIGSIGGTNIYGSMQNVIAASDSLGLEVRMDVTGGTNYASMGWQQLVSVPFAFQSIHADLSSYSDSSAYAKSSKYTDSLTLPYTGNDNTINSFVVNNFYNGAGVAIKGTSFTNNTNAVGLFGVVPLGNTLGTGVRGQAFANGALAIEGVNTGGGVAIRGKATGATGIAVYAENTNASGKALDVNGNVRIAGGNTSPGEGKVLTSDASGNATWKDPLKVAFRATGENTSSPTIPSNTPTVVPLQSEIFDIGGNFNPSNAATDPNTFIAPVNGVYHFSVHIKSYITSNVYNISESEIILRRNGNTTSYLEGTPAETNPQSSVIQLSLDQTVQLNAGDKIQFLLYQYNSGNLNAKYLNADFSGHLVFEL